MISIVVPIHNEEPSILPLYDRLTAVMERLQRPYEILFVDDASTDRSFDLLANLVETDQRLKVIRLRRNFGQTPALQAGFDEAQGEVIISMDGDLQHDPEDIPALLEKVEQGWDIASGWRKNRIDNAITRKIPSRIANWLMAKASGIELHDFGTTFKAYRAEILKDINLYGELHRFIPALAKLYGARVVEVPIKNTPRAAGDSHYGLGRTFRVLYDIMTIKFLLTYFTRPMHFFGTLGLAGTGERRNAHRLRIAVTRSGGNHFDIRSLHNWPARPDDCQNIARRERADGRHRDVERDGRARRNHVRSRRLYRGTDARNSRRGHPHDRG